jgi:hypothetical protein
MGSEKGRHCRTRPWFSGSSTTWEGKFCSSAAAARRIFARLEWLPPGGHAPHRRLQAAAAHYGAFKAPLRKSGISGDFARAKIRRAAAVLWHPWSGVSAGAQVRFRLFLSLVIWERIPAARQAQVGTLASRFAILEPIYKSVRLNLRISNIVKCICGQPDRLISPILTFPAINARLCRQYAMICRFRI